ncbi:MAG: hypothetical protein ABIT01_10010 [Thermoanaerobaculia bacterium]
MGAADHAIVVGIDAYPSLGDLDGAVADARDFEAWLLDARGGNVPRANVDLLLSSPATPAVAPHKARPQIGEVNALFDELYETGQQSGRVGDRLYLFFAGHGFAKDIESAALLMANAARGAVAGRHFPGRPYANWFRQAAFFREVVLFMDCCRETYSLTNLAAVPYDMRIGDPPGRKFFGFATKWSRAAREIGSGPANQKRGLFTLALLSGLRGGAQSNANGQVKGLDLESWVINYVRKERQLDDDEMPEFDYSKTTDLMFNADSGEPPSNSGAAARPPSPPGPSYVVHARASNGGAHLDYELTDGAFQTVAPQTRTDSEWTWRVDRPGLYKLHRVGGGNQILEVIGDREVIDVVL